MGRMWYGKSVIWGGCCMGGCCMGRVWYGEGGVWGGRE